MGRASVRHGRSPFPVLETPRLLLRPPRLSDAPGLLAFLGDPLAMRFTQARSSLRDCRRYLAAHERQRARVGCAPWTVLDKAEGRIIGFGGLYEDPFDPGWGIEVAYFFHPTHWGRGYAGELVEACLDLARDELDLATLWAFAHEDNRASVRVLERAGFTRRRFVPALERWLFGRDLSRP